MSIEVFVARFLLLFEVQMTHSFLEILILGSSAISIGVDSHQAEKLMLRPRTSEITISMCVQPKASQLTGRKQAFATEELARRKKPNQLVTVIFITFDRISPVLWALYWKNPSWKR